MKETVVLTPTKAGRVTIPKWLREELDLEENDQLRVTFDENTTSESIRLEGRAEHLENLNLLEALYEELGIETLNDEIEIKVTKK